MSNVHGFASVPFAARLEISYPNRRDSPPVTAVVLPGDRHRHLPGRSPSCFPVSSLGHSVLIAALLGWTDLVKAQSRRDASSSRSSSRCTSAPRWRCSCTSGATGSRSSAASSRSARGNAEIVSPAARLGLLLIVATIPAGLIGVRVRARAARRVRQAVRGGRVPHRQRRDPPRRRAAPAAAACAGARAAAIRRPRTPNRAGSIESLTYGEAIFVGVAQIGALFAGISRSGITMVAGPHPRPRPRGRGTLRVPARDADHRWRPASTSCPTSSATSATACGCSRSSARSSRRPARTSRPAFLVRFFRSQTLWPFGDLLPRRRRRLHDPLRLSQNAASRQLHMRL